jgi:hypothetical protein
VGDRSDRPAIDLPEATSACVVLIDGLGLELLLGCDRRSVPFLHAMLAEGASGDGLDACFPSSTPISLCSLGTGRTPGEHGIVGFTMHVPPVPHVLECLAWTAYGSRIDLSVVLPPETLQPCEPLAASAARGGIATTVVSLAEHVGTGLTRAAFRGAVFDSFARFDDLDGRVASVARRLRAGRALVYTYDARLDTAAHVYGIGSAEWRDALVATDRLLAALARALPPGAVLLVTGDHGGLNVPAPERIDLADRPDLAADVAFLSGDPRTRHVHAAPGRADRLLDVWRGGLDDGWVVLSRTEVVGAGLLGPAVRDNVLPRIGDVVAVATGGAGVFDRTRFPWELRLAAFHGAMTPAELRVPLLIHRA